MTEQTAPPLPNVIDFLDWYMVEAYHSKDKEWSIIALFRFEPEAAAYTQRHDGDGGIKLRYSRREPIA